MSRIMRVMCPHCKGHAGAGAARQLSATHREQWFKCDNPECGHIFIVGITAIRTLSPSSMPDPEVNLPYSPNVRRRELVASLQEPSNAPLP